MPLVHQPFFSVIIPAHNKAPYLSRSIGCVLDQSFEDYEVLVVDDASTDGSREILRRFDDSRLRLFRRDQPGPGGYAARNLGIKEARGRWVAFLDADDEWLPDHLSALHNLASHPHTLVASTAWVTNHDDGRVMPSSFSCRYAETEILRLSFRDFLKETASKRSPIWTGVAAAERSLIAKLGGFPESCKRGGDVATWLLLVHTAQSILCATKRTAVYHREVSDVTRFTPLEVANNCVYLACKRLLSEINDKSERRLLMRFSNSYVKNGLNKRRVNGELRFSDCGFHYFWADPRHHLFLRACSLLPSWAQKYGFRAYKMAKDSLVAR